MRTSTKAISAAGRPVNKLALRQDWAEVFSGNAREALVAALQAWLPTRRWFRSKARTIASLRLREQIPVPLENSKAFLLLFQVTYAEGEAEMYVMPLAAALGEAGGAVAREFPQLVLAQVSLTRLRQTGVLYDAIVSKEFCHALLEMTAVRHKVPGSGGELEAEPTNLLRRMRQEEGLDIEASVSKAEQSNSSIIYKSRLILKFFRRLDQGVNPELEIERFLAAHHFPHSPALAGALEYHDQEGRTSTMAVMTSFVPGCHDAWEDTLEGLKQFYDRVAELPEAARKAPPASLPSGRRAPEGPARPASLIGSYLQDARTIGQRTASLHLTLASDAKNRAFRPEPWTLPAQRNLFKSLRHLTEHSFELLRRRLPTLDAETRSTAERTLPLQTLIIERLKRVAENPAGAVRIRTHGDYHLGQVLHHNADFLIIDFEGEPALSLKDRRAKQSALRDVAGMIYSFFYAANAALRELPHGHPLRAHPETGVAWARYWSLWVGTTFLRAYLKTAGGAAFIPANEPALKIMLDVELLRKAIYELGYELNNRPDWLKISFQVLFDLLNPDNPI